ncbi:MAG: hypothetical protein ACLT40_00470 [Fusobacterium sp.]
MKRTIEMYKNIMETQSKIKSLYGDVKSRMEEMIKNEEELNDSFLLKEYPVMSKQDMTIIAQAVEFFNQQMEKEEISVKAYIPIISIVVADDEIVKNGKGQLEVFIIVK